MMNRHEAAERCLNCRRDGDSNYCYCRKFLQADLSRLEKCIMDYDCIKNIKPDSAEEFMFNNNQQLFYQYVNRGKILEVGDIVITLRPGFGSSGPGKLLRITKTHGYGDYYSAEAVYPNQNDSSLGYGIQPEWWLDAFKIEGKLTTVK